MRQDGCRLRLQTDYVCTVLLASIDFVGRSIVIGVYHCHFLFRHVTQINFAAQTAR